jgi:hypothetical protein
LNKQFNQNLTDLKKQLQALNTHKQDTMFELMMQRNYGENRMRNRLNQEITNAGNYQPPRSINNVDKPKPSWG